MLQLLHINEEEMDKGGGIMEKEITSRVIRLNNDELKIIKKLIANEINANILSNDYNLEDKNKIMFVNTLIKLLTKIVHKR